MPPRDLPHEPTAEDFDLIREAVVETPRGRWFLDEYAARLRCRENERLADGMKRLEQAVNANHDAVMAQLALILAREEAAVAAAPQAPQAGLAPRHMKYFKADEEVFEPAPHATIAAVPQATPAVPHTFAAAAAAEAQVRQAETPARRRIFIIRHQPGEAIEVPLADELARAS